MSEQTKREHKNLLATLAQLGGKLTAEEDVVFSGTKIVLPERMNIPDAIRFLKDKEAEDEEEMNFSRIFKYRPWDGARATSIALRKAFGMTRQQPIMTMFGKQPPQLITINVGVDEQEQVPWGAITIPILPNSTIYLGGTRDAELGTLFAVTVTAPRKHRFHIEGIFRLIEDELSTNSMYRGKAFDGREEAEFLDLSGVRQDKVVYSDDVITQLEANVWGQLRYSNEMRAQGLPLKRAVLLEGPYGTGKTLAAFLTAQEAINNGWTFIYCRPGRDNLRDTMATAQLYQPSVVFFEDVDVIADSDQGTDTVSTLLDVFDGIQAKGTEILAVLTTNHVDQIHKGMCRPGRLDAIIHVGSLDRNGVQRLVEVTVPADLLDTNIDYDAVHAAMEGYMPAFCKEAVDRSIRYSLTRGKGVSATITTEDLINAAQGLRAQFELMSGAHEGKDKDPLSEAFGRVLRTGLHGVAIREKGSDYEPYEIAGVASTPLS